MIFEKDLVHYLVPEKRFEACQPFHTLKVIINYVCYMNSILTHTCTIY